MSRDTIAAIPKSACWIAPITIESAAGAALLIVALVVGLTTAGNYGAMSAIRGQAMAQSRRFVDAIVVQWWYGDALSYQRRSLVDLDVFSLFLALPFRPLRMFQIRT